MIRAQKHPGKFEGGLLIDEWLWHASLDGGPDEEVGEAERDSYYGLMAGGLGESVERAAEDAGESLSLEERKFIQDNPAAIIFENSQGFVDVTWYESEAAARKEYERIAAEIEAEEEESGEDDE